MGILLYPDVDPDQSNSTESKLNQEQYSVVFFMEFTQVVLAVTVMKIYILGGSSNLFRIGVYCFFSYLNLCQ